MLAPGGPFSTLSGGQWLHGYSEILEEVDLYYFFPPRPHRPPVAHGPHVGPVLLPEGFGGL